MPQSLTLADARAFLRVTDTSDDAVITILIDAAEAHVAAAAGVVLTPTSPAPLRLSVLTLVAHAYEHRTSPGADPETQPWLTPYRKARL